MHVLAGLFLLVALPLSECTPGPQYGVPSACEVRTFTLDAREALRVRNPVSGAITVHA